MRRYLVALGLVACSGCARDPLEQVCPPAATGELVVTEIRADQGGTYPQFIELYNASGLSLDLEGTIIEVLSVDGGTRLKLIVRAPLPVADGEYVALGDGTVDRPFLAYHFGADFEVGGTLKDIPPSGRITVTTCGDEIDVVDYALPSEGTWSLGVVPPSADGNDVDGAWCADTTPSADTTELGLPGTPGAANIPCATPSY